MAGFWVQQVSLPTARAAVRSGSGRSGHSCASFLVGTVWSGRAVRYGSGWSGHACASLLVGTIRAVRDGPGRSGSTVEDPLRVLGFCPHCRGPVVVPSQLKYLTCRRAHCYCLLLLPLLIAIAYCYCHCSLLLLVAIATAHCYCLLLSPLAIAIANCYCQCPLPLPAPCPPTETRV